MGILFSVKIFDVVFSRDLYVLRFPEFKKWLLEIGLCICVHVCMWLQGEYLALYISKTNKDTNFKFYSHCYISTKIIFPGFGESWETGSVVWETGNETGSEYVKKGSNDFL